MASTAIIGLPGGGKSYYAVEVLLQFLETDSRHVVTNIPLIPDEVSRYIIQRNGDFAVLDRITLIDPLDFARAKNFYLHRGNGIMLEAFPQNFDQFSNGHNIDIELIHETFGGGVVYFLDEVHQFLNARNWSSVGGDILRYLSLHRHLGDDIFWITQAPGNVDKQWRSLTQSYFTCRNFKYEKFRGFSKGTEMEVRETLNLPSPHNTEIAQSVVTRKINPAIGACYKTSIIHGDADTKRPNKGISYKWIIVVIFVVLLLGAFGIAKGFSYGANRVATAFGMGQKKPKPPTSQEVQPFDTSPQTNVEPSPTHPKQSSIPSDIIFRPDSITPPGYVPSTEKSSLMLPANTPEAHALGIIPPTPSPLTVQAWITRGNRISLMINGLIYEVGDTLEDGNRLLEIPTYGKGHPVSIDSYGRYHYHPATNNGLQPIRDEKPESDPTDSPIEPTAPTPPRDIPGAFPMDSEASSNPATKTPNQFARSEDWKNFGRKQ